MRFFIVCFLTFLQKDKKDIILSIKNSNTLWSTSTHDGFIIKKPNNKFSGNDERFPINDTNYYEKEEEINKIRVLFEKKRLLDYLENDKISIYNKLNLLRDDNVKVGNLTYGGLFEKDWNFTPF
jgi:hypothetical protein